MRIETLVQATAGAAAATALAIGNAPIWLATATAALAAWTAARSARTRATAAALQQALERRDEQLAHTAHELRTPLASVALALEMLRDGYVTAPAEVDEFVGRAALAARHLAFLVDDVLDAAALAHGRLRMQVEDLRLCEPLATAQQVLEVQAQARGVVLQFPPVDVALAVRADERRLLQVVFNLVGNAIKHSPAGAPVRVDVEPVGAAVRLSVSDRGPGVPEAARASLFTPFGGTATGAGAADGGANVPGTGLGLHVCRRIVEQLGGRIGHRPGPGGGAVFWFELPRAEAGLAVAATPAAPP